MSSIDKNMIKPSRFDTVQDMPGFIGKSNDRWAQLAVLRETVTKTSGGLHSGQLLQLKYWPFVAAPHCKRHETVPDIETKTVTVNLELEPNSTPPIDFKNRLEAFGRSVKDMLGTEWNTIIYADGGLIFNNEVVKVVKKKAKVNSGKKRRIKRSPTRRR